MENNIKVLVIHVRGQKERESFIRQQLASLDLPTEYILDGNKEDLTSDILSRYFRDDEQGIPMCGQFARTSCTYKHLLACRYIIEHQLPGALVVEDDLKLKKNFHKAFGLSMQELKRYHSTADGHLEACIVNYEESALLLVPRSQRRSGQMLYSAARDRFAGCIFVSQKAAQTMLHYAESEKLDEPIDRIHSRLVEQGLIRYFWSYPTLACQCSCDGSMPTMIPTRPRPWKRLKWFWKRAYKHLLYQFR